MHDYDNDDDGMMGVLGDVGSFMDDRLFARTPEAPNQANPDFMTAEAKPENLPHGGRSDGGIVFTEEDLGMYAEQDMERGPMSSEEPDVGELMDHQAVGGMSGVMMGGAVNPIVNPQNPEESFMMGGDPQNHSIKHSPDLPVPAGYLGVEPTYENVDRHGVFPAWQNEQSKDHPRTREQLRDMSGVPQDQSYPNNNSPWSDDTQQIETRQKLKRMMNPGF